MEILLDPHQYNSVVKRVSSRMGEPEAISLRQINPDIDTISLDVVNEEIKFGKESALKSLLLESSPYSRQLRHMICSQNICRARMVRMINSKGYIIDQTFLVKGNYLMHINPRTGVSYMFRISQIALPTLDDPEVSVIEPLGSEYHIQLSELMREGGGLFVGDVNLEEMEIIWIEINKNDISLFLDQPYSFL